MKFFKAFEKLMRAIFPSTFTIAIMLTVLTILLALFMTDPVDPASSSNPVLREVANDPLSNSNNHLLQILGFWYTGLWNTGLLAFSVQMMLILVLGYVIASTKAKQTVIKKALKYINNTASAALLVALLTILLSLFNWGLGLIFGAIFARKVGEYARQKDMNFNYPLIGAAGYSGLMVWHGGISGSAPLKAAEKGHFLALLGKDLDPLYFNVTIFSTMNLVVALTLVVVIPTALFMLGKRMPGNKTNLPAFSTPISEPHEQSAVGAERLDHSAWVAYLLGGSFILLAAIKAIIAGDFSVVDPNYLNFLLLGIAIVLCGTIHDFLLSVKKAIGAAAGILIQFPLYFGIMGIMKYSGLVEDFSVFLMEISNETTFPVFTFFSAGLVNIFVPSGGGQWAVQGPIIVDAAQSLGVPLPKAIMALAYGDQLTNMLQPFWALPLLGITGLKASEIIPYTLFLMLLGAIIFIGGLLIF